MLGSIKTSLSTYFLAIVSYGRVHSRWLMVLAVLVVLTPMVVLVGSAAVIAPYEQYVLSERDSRQFRTGIVMGAGVTWGEDGKPYRELQGRLDVAAQAVWDGTVDKLILSGDNRFDKYNEPRAMMNYLVNTKHISPASLQPDYAGRSTYETCERAAKVFGIKQTVIISAHSHLPRAIFLCRHHGVEAYGLASTVEANNSTRREALARIKAVYNAYVKGEDTILGNQVKL